jgi:TM2 domain-containing membrane protein YozV
MRYDANKKSALLAYVIWFFLGWAGIHRLYLGRITSGLLMLVMLGVSWLLHFVLIGFLGYLIIIPWWAIDALLIPGMTRDYNNRLIDRLRR